MADWNAPLPPTATEGAETHIEDHNTILAVLQELRSVIDGIEASVTSNSTGVSDNADAISALDTRVTALEPEA